MIKALEKQYKSDKADAFQARYFAAKAKLFNDILRWIRSNEPNLSDHSEQHIENVLNNAYKLISTEIDESLDSENPIITGLDLYFLCQVCLFHDVGNFYGRKSHNQKISEIINKAFGDLFDGEHKRERRLIAEAGRAHTGKEGKDTLLDLFNKNEHIQGDHIHYCAIAAIVRFADELAEGPQRTSAFMLDEDKFSSDSKIFHKYATCTHIKIDSPNQRISISYEFNIEISSSDNEDEIKKELKDLLAFTYSRISKLDQERKYYNYYAKISRPIREVQVIFNFQKDDYDIEFKLDPLILNDLIVPGNSHHFFLENRVDLDIETVLAHISNEIFATE
ncbi:MAG: hypothetical protein BVN35_16765 [Proteobacteria bacterium ST_bin11]|nr:MAG: hypothetical protein BVN35_16765 [Proteobacteria bacterium ST_bin11]